ncbi:MAG: hypothetical protein ACRYFU_10520 [Janthinobacterium lividum]
MSMLRSALSLLAAISMTIVAAFHFTHTPQLTLGERAGALVFELLLAAMFLARFLYRLRYPSQSDGER